MVFCGGRLSRKWGYIFTFFFFIFIIFPVFNLSGAGDESLFSPVDSLSRAQSEAQSPEIIRSRLVTIQWDQLCHIENGARSQSYANQFHYIPLNLFQDVQYDAYITDIQNTYSGGVSMTGSIEGFPGSQVTLVRTGDILSGNIAVNRRFYQIRYIGDTLHRVQETDQSQFPSELPPVSVDIKPSQQPDPAIEYDPGIYIDILVVYTAAARSAAGGTTAMENLIDLAVSETNTGYSNSGVTQRLRLVHTAEVDYSEASFNWSTTLTRLRSTSDGYMDDVHTLRDTYGADEVVLLVNNTASCGIAYVMQTVTTAFATASFAVVSRVCATGYYSFAHELGHNMGSAHDRANASISGAYDYSYGYQAPDEAFRTIMSYNCPGNCTRVNYWSNPGKTYGGQDMGVLYTDPLAADNRRSLNNTLSTVRNFRQSVGSASITVTAPNGGESWEVGSTHQITWSTTGVVGNVKIEYYSSNNPGGVTVVSSTANDGSYNWTIPDDISDTCGIRISEASDGSPEDFNNDFFAIVAAGTAPTITVNYPNGGESLTSGNQYTIAWSTDGTVGNVKIQYSTNNGGNWTTITSSTANDGSYTWTAPSVNSTKCKIKISEASDGNPYDTSDSTFSISTSAGTTPTITVNSPNGGETLESGTTHTITWSYTGTVGKVKIEYTTDSGSSWNTIVSSTANDGSYNWTVPTEDSGKCKIRIKEASDGDPSDTSDSTFTIDSPTPPEIVLHRTKFNFGSRIGGGTTSAQSLRIENDGGGTLDWSAAADVSWINLSPPSGSGSGVVSISVDTSGLSAGTHNGTISVSDSNASNSPQTVSVTLRIKEYNADNAPIGGFDSPADGAVVSSSIPVTGWVVDDIDVASVTIYNGNNPIGTAVFVEGARTDIEGLYPDNPKSFQAGWGYMMLTNFLPNGGNGSYNLRAVATDNSGFQTLLGSITITVDNVSAVKPFGAIETPDQGGIASGSSFSNWGWVLTPPPNSIPNDGSTIDVIIDGVSVGHPTYGLYRGDIAGMFPGYANSDGAFGLYTIDTSAYENGIHIIQWVATDNAGNRDGIGSRYFTIQNTGTPRSAGTGASYLNQPLESIAHIQPVQELRGDDAVIHIQVRQLEPVAIPLGAPVEGYTVVGKQLRPLPIGSTLDREKGVYYWSPGPGFIGRYQFLFIQEDTGIKKHVFIDIR